jgi:hypothetical protein
MKPIAIVGLLMALGCSAVQAETFKKCSGEGASRETLTIDNSTAKATLRIASNQENLEFLGVAGLGLNGFALQDKQGRTERLYVFPFEEASRINAADNEPAAEIWVFRDRAYWPCDK